MQIKIPCVIMRGGTSRGPYFLASDLPTDVATRDQVLLAAMGSPHMLQVDGIGGGHPLTSKVAIISRSTHPEADIDYLFAQVSIDKALVDTNPNCGNMLAGVGPFAIEAGLIEATPGETRIRILNKNTNAIIEAFIQTPNGEVEYDGDTAIDGAPGTAAPVKLNFLAATGSKTGALFATGKRREEIQGLPVTLIDYAMPMMLVPASALGITGHETAEAIDAMPELFKRLEAARREAGVRMGLGDVSEKVVPKIGILSAPTKGGTITSRYLVPDRCHKSHAVTGALCVASAARIPGTVADGIAQLGKGNTVTVEHPSGKLSVDIEIDQPANGDPVIKRAAVLRTTRRLFEGKILVPEKAWPARRAASERVLEKSAV